MKKAQSYPCEECGDDSANDDFSIYIDRITDLERRNAELTALLGAMCSWFEDAAKIAGWTPDNANAAWAAHRAARAAMLARTKEQK